MKRFHQITVALIAVAILTTSVEADNPLDKLGRGRLLRKIRDELVGKPQQDKQKKKADSKTPTPAKRPTGKNSPTPAQQASWSKNGANPQTKLTSQQIKDRRRTAQKFGMYVQGNKDRFYVAQIDPKGNAAKAGVKRGDQLVQIGGTNLESIEEFYEIANILGEGDGIEFEIARNGKKKTVMIQYGELKEPTDEEIGEEKPVASTASAKSNGFGYQGKTSSQFRSVLERSGFSKKTRK